MPCIITPEQAGHKNICAFLDLLGWSEGTDKKGQPTQNNGYDVLVGGKLFTDFSKHPNILVQLKPGLASTAAGRYQLLFRYFKPYAELLKLKDFGPLSQDKIAIQQIRERKAIDLIKAGKIELAISQCRNIWASLPGAGYGQHEHKLDNLFAAYDRAGGTFA